MQLLTYSLVSPKPELPQLAVEATPGQQQTAQCCRAGAERTRASSKTHLHLERLMHGLSLQGWYSLLAMQGSPQRRLLLPHQRPSQGQCLSCGAMAMLCSCWPAGLCCCHSRPVLHPCQLLLCHPRSAQYSACSCCCPQTGGLQAARDEQSGWPRCKLQIVLGSVVLLACHNMQYAAALFPLLSWAAFAATSIQGHT